MTNAPKYIEELIESLTKFPGIGRKGAERIAYFIVKSDKSFGKNLINAITDVNEKLDICPTTGMVFLKGEDSPLSDKNRNSELLCVVENMEDVIKIENTNSFDGLYHVLGGAIHQNYFNFKLSHEWRVTRTTFRLSFASSNCQKAENCIRFPLD